MTGLKLTAIFFFTLLLDGLILPALFGFEESLFSFLVIIMPLICLGLTSRSVVFGMVFSIIYELAKGLDFGVLAVPFLFIAITVFLVQRFLDIKRAYFFALASAVFVYLLFFFYNRGELAAGYFSPVIVLTVITEALVLAAIFNVTFEKNSNRRNV